MFFFFFFKFLSNGAKKSIDQKTESSVSPVFSVFTHIPPISPLTHLSPEPGSVTDGCGGGGGASRRDSGAEEGGAVHDVHKAVEGDAGVGPDQLAAERRWVAGDNGVCADRRRILGAEDRYAELANERAAAPDGAVPCAAGVLHAVAVPDGK